MSGFIVKARDMSTMQLVFYTGRAGAGWISDKRNEAFVYATELEAARKAGVFRRARTLRVWMTDYANPDDAHNAAAASMSQEACG